MAQKRMFSLEIVDTDLFLDMPSSTQNLYFHLGMRADDDGFVSSPKKITGMVNCSQDDLKLLAAKNLIIPFETGVVVIKDWKANNYIRNDRYTPTKYIKELESLEIDSNGSYFIKNMEKSCLPSGIPSDNQAVDKCHPQVRLGKVRLELDKSSNTSAGGSGEIIPYEDIVNLYNKICISLKPVSKLTPKRKVMIGARYKEHKSELLIFKDLFSKAQASEFLKGKNSRNWTADFDWLLNAEKMIRVLEGKYDNNQNKGQAQQATKPSVKQNRFVNYQQRNDWDFEELERLEREYIDAELKKKEGIE